MDLRKYIKIVPSAPDQGATGSAQPPRRELAIAAVILAALLLGAAMGRALPTKPEAVAVAPSGSTAPQAAEPFVYFPSQYVIQATEREEHIQAY